MLLFLTDLSSIPSCEKSYQLVPGKLRVLGGKLFAEPQGLNYGLFTVRGNSWNRRHKAIVPGVTRSQIKGINLKLQEGIGSTLMHLSCEKIYDARNDELLQGLGNKVVFCTGTVISTTGINNTGRYPAIGKDSI